jgi:hypothetical protein
MHHPNPNHLTRTRFEHVADVPRTRTDQGDFALAIHLFRFEKNYVH